MTVPPTIIVGGVNQSANQGQVEVIVTELVAAVPELKALFEEADKIKDRVPDVRTRLGIVMSLKGITPQGAHDIIAGLEQALTQVKQASDDELRNARIQKVDEPNRQVAQKEARRQALNEELQSLGQEIGVLRQSIEMATQQIGQAAGQFQSNLSQVQAWIRSTAEQLGIQQPSN